MTFIFKNALVRKASNNIVKALSSKKLDPSFEKINNEHNEYIRALKKSALNVIIFETLNELITGTSKNSRHAVKCNPL